MMPSLLIITAFYAYMLKHAIDGHWFNLVTKIDVAFFNVLYLPKTEKQKKYLSFFTLLTVLSQNV